MEGYGEYLEMLAKRKMSAKKIYRKQWKENGNIVKMKNENKRYWELKLYNLL